MTGDMPAIVMWHAVPTEVETIYIYECSVCHAVHRETWKGTATIVPSGARTEGWTELSPSVWICDKHQVVILVDGKPFDPQSPD